MCPGVRLCRYQGVMVSGCADVRVLVCVLVCVQVSGCAGVRVCCWCEGAGGKVVSAEGAGVRVFCCSVSVGVRVLCLPLL